MEFISLDELQNRDANKAFFELLSENNTHKEFVTAWNSYVTDTKLNKGLDFSQFRFDLNDENRDCFKCLLTEESHVAQWQFNGLLFPRETDFSKAQFAGHACFGEAQFAEVAYFIEAQFERMAYFSEAEFAGEAYFREAEFAGEAYFREAKFAGEARFSEAQFKGWAFFTKAQFAGEASFSEAQFEGQANFSKVQFEGRADITNITCPQDIKLHQAIANSSFYLSFKAEFKENIDLGGAIFDKYSSFDISNVNIIPEFDLAHFTNIALLKINDDFKERKNTKQELSLNTARFLKRYYANSLCHEEKHMYFAKELKESRPGLFKVYDFVSKCGVSFLRPFGAWIGVCFMLLLFICIEESILTSYLTYDYHPLQLNKGCFELSNILIRTLYPIHFKCMLPIVAWWESLILVGQSIINLGCIFLMGLALKNQLKIK